MINPAKVAAALGLASIAGLAAANADDGPTLQKIRKSAAITIGYRDAAIPFSYAGAEQKPIGFSLDLCGLIAEKVKEKLRLSEIKIDYKPVTDANRAALVKDGAVDIECGATPKTADLAKDAAFSIPIYASELRWLVLRQIRVEKGRRAPQPRTRSRRSPAADDLRGPDGRVDERFGGQLDCPEPERGPFSRPFDPARERPRGRVQARRNRKGGSLHG